MTQIVRHEILTLVCKRNTLALKTGPKLNASYLYLHLFDLLHFIRAHPWLDITDVLIKLLRPFSILFRCFPDTLKEMTRRGQNRSLIQWIAILEEHVHQSEAELWLNDVSNNIVWKRFELMFRVTLEAALNFDSIFSKYSTVTHLYYDWVYIYIYIIYIYIYIYMFRVTLDAALNFDSIFSK